MRRRCAARQNTEYAELEVDKEEVYVPLAAEGKHAWSWKNFGDAYVTRTGAAERLKKKEAEFFEGVRKFLEKVVDEPHYAANHERWTVHLQMAKEAIEAEAPSAYVIV